MCVFAMNCVVPSVRLPQVCGHILVPETSDCCCGRTHARLACRDSCAQQARSTYAPINKYITSAANKHKHKLTYFSFPIAVNKNLCFSEKKICVFLIRGVTLGPAKML